MLDMIEFAWNDALGNLLQVGLTASAAALVLLLLRRVMKKRYPARAVCVVWAILAVRLLIPVQLTLPDPPVQVTPRTTYLTRTDFAPDQLEEAGLPVLELDGEITTRRWVTQEQAQALTPYDMPSLISFDLGAVLSVVWVAGIALFALWQVYRYLPFRHVLEKSSYPAERETLQRVFEEQKRSLGIKRNIPLRVTPAADCPMLAGFIKPALYLPDEALYEQEAGFIFRHELTHYKRADLWLKLLLTAARAMHWFNPLVHLMARFAQEDIELACDDAVVRGMDGEARRAYGETILRSAAAQARKRALVSCFTGDKQGLMRRFEGIFDKRVKKRGVALILAAAVLVGTLGCAVSVGESKDSSETFEARALEAANVWAQSYVNEDYEAHQRYLSPQNETYSAESFGTGVADYQRYVVEYEPEDQTCLIVYEYVLDEARVQAQGVQGVQTNIPYREAQRLYFIEENGTLLIDEAIWVASSDESDLDGAVTSLDEFRLLYENDLGLPDFLSVPDANTQIDISTPEQAAINLLHLQGNTAVREGTQEDIREVTTAFADGSEVKITMVNQFGEGWLPQDFTYDGGQNDRTAADLAQQYARGVVHKSGQYIYPILTAAKQQDFVTQQGTADGGMNWRYGGASPSYRDYALSPTSGGDYIAVFQMYGGGATDYRSAVNITVSTENGRQVITAIDRCDEQLSFILDQMSGQDTDYTQSELFRLYYDSGLAWPTIPEGADSFNGVQLDGLTTPLGAIEAVFGYFGETYGEIEGNTTHIRMRTWYTVELVQQSGNEAVVRLSFTDNSPSAEVRMQKTGDYWLPVGLAEQFDDSFTATGDGSTQPDYTITSTTYHNDTYGYTLTLPDCFVGQGYAKETSDSTVQFGLQNALPGYSDDPTDGGTVMGLYVQATASLKAQFGEDWQAGYPVPCKELTERDGLTYYLAFASDVQYDPADAEITAQYGEMRQAAEAMGGSAISFDGQTDAQAGREQQRVLHDLAEQHAYMENQMLSGGLPIDLVTVEPNLTDGSCLLVVRYMGQAGDYYFTTAQRLWYEGTDTTTPSRTETLVNTSGGMRSLEQFILAFPLEQEMPYFDGRGLESLSDKASRPASLDNPDLSTPEACAASVLHLVGGEWTDAADDALSEDTTWRTYQWDDGYVQLTLQRVQLTDDSPVLWLPIGWRTEESGIGFVGQWPHYYAVLARMMDYYPYRTTVELVQALNMGWADGAYAEGIFAELDKRWQQDADAVEDAIAGFGTDVQTLWETHKAANPDLFGARSTEDEIEAAYQEGRDMGAMDPNRYMALKETNDFSDCSAEELAYYLTLSDGAYTENILYELDLRWQDDPEGTDAAVAAYADAADGVSSPQTIWETHKAANPDFFS